MAFQNVSVPRIYTNDISLSKELNVYTNTGSIDESIFDDNPSNITNISLEAGATNTSAIFTRFNVSSSSRPNYYAILGHNLASEGVGVRQYSSINGTFNGSNNAQPLVNGNTESFDVFGDGGSHGMYLKPALDGFSICNITNDSNDATYFEQRFEFDVPYSEQGNKNLVLGSIFTGRYFDLPQTPDMKLKIGFEMDGIKSTQTLAGATISNANFTKPANWGPFSCWELDNITGFRNGRRVYDLSFSMLSDENIWNDNLSTTLSTGVGTVQDTTNIFDGDTFFNIWNRTMGGHLPFIFQPDNTNFRPDQFSLCRFDQDSLEVQQIGHRLYNIKVTLRESW